LIPAETGLTFHHLGLAVEKPDRARRFVEGLGYRCSRALFDPLQGVHLIFYEHAQAPAVEIVYPGDKPGPLDLILQQQSAQIYHMCYETAHIESALSALRSAGHRLLKVTDPKPAVLFNDRRVSFHMVAGFGLIELLETEKHSSDLLPG
jgi:methylmalonyl-CoA/ethylmalonyl-CoA epimerase